MIPIGFQPVQSSSITELIIQDKYIVVRPIKVFSGHPHCYGVVTVNMKTGAFCQNELFQQPKMIYRVIDYENFYRH